MKQVKFKMQWYGEEREFLGEVLEFTTRGTWVVKYDIPPECPPTTDEALQTLEAPIELFTPVELKLGDRVQVIAPKGPKQRQTVSVGAIGTIVSTGTGRYANRVMVEIENHEEWQRSKNYVERDRLKLLYKPKEDLGFSVGDRVKFWEDWGDDSINLEGTIVKVVDETAIVKYRLEIDKGEKYLMKSRMYLKQLTKIG